MKPTEFIKCVYCGDDLIHPIYGKVTIKLGPLINGNCVFLIESSGQSVEGNIKDLFFFNDVDYYFVSKSDLLSQNQIDLLTEFMNDNYIYDVNLLDHFDMKIKSVKNLKKRF